MHVDYVIGDTLYIAGTLTGENLPALPWTGATATITLWLKGGKKILDAVAVTTLTVATGAFDYAGATSVLTQPGDYEGRIRVTFLGGQKQSFPSELPFTLTARLP